MEFDTGILSSRERNVFDLLKVQNEVTTDDMIKMIKETEGKEVKSQSAIVCIKYLQAKVAEYGFIIKKTSGVGAGKKGTYSMEKVETK